MVFGPFPSAKNSTKLPELHKPSCVLMVITSLYNSLYNSYVGVCQLAQIGLPSPHGSNQYPG